MYRLGRRIRHHHLLLIAGVVLVVVFMFGGLSLKHLFKVPPTTIKQSKAITVTVAGNDDITKSFDEGIYSLALPSDWKYDGRDATTIYHPYIFTNTAGNAGSRQLDVYVDNIPTSLPVNLMLPVTAAGNRLTTGQVSSNCINFTSSSGAEPNGGVPAKWAGVNFICDTANYERDVVGTSSASAVNSVSLSGPASGAHSFFFTYTDNNGEPDYSIFSNALTSFVLK